MNAEVNNWLINQILLRTSLSSRVVKAVDAKLALSRIIRIHSNTKAVIEEFSLNGVKACDCGNFMWKQNLREDDCLTKNRYHAMHSSSFK